MMDGSQAVAIVCANSLTTLGLRELLHNVLPPGVEIVTFSNVAQLREQGDRFVHYFVDISSLLPDKAFFQERNRKTIVLTTTPDHEAQLPEFHCLCVAVPENQLLRALLLIQQRGHNHRNNISMVGKNKKRLTPREVEVLSLVAQGLINKEIADRLHISLATVITHRKNIVEKLGVRSVPALTMYAVINGYVDVHKI